MLSLENQTPLETRAVPLRDKEGYPVVVLVAKGTYCLSPDGGCQFAKEQSPLVEADEYYGDPETTSVRYESDFAIFKPATDVIVIGSACAPKGKPVRQLDVSLSVGPIARTIRVFGNRRWKSGLLSTTASEPEEFTRMPLTFENAFGGRDATHKDTTQHGWEPRNLVGRGFRINANNESEKGKSLDGWPLPNLEDPASPIKSWKDKPAPVATGFVGRSWQPRLGFAGTYDDAWTKKRCPILPLDFDYRFFIAAPAGQFAPAYFKGGETVTLTNLTPEGRLSFALSRVQPIVETRCLKQLLRRELVLDTVVLSTDERLCFLVWRTTVRYRDSLDDFEGAVLTQAETKS
jgi:hypothetical protein